MSFQRRCVCGPVKFARCPVGCAHSVLNAGVRGSIFQHGGASGRTGPAVPKGGASFLAAP